MRWNSYINMIILNLNIIAIEKAITLESDNCTFWVKKTSLEWGLNLFSSHTDNDYLPHTAYEEFILWNKYTAEWWFHSEDLDYYNSDDFIEGNFAKFLVVSELETDKGNLCQIFRAVGDSKKLFSCYYIGDKKIIKDDAIWALANLNLK